MMRAGRRPTTTPHHLDVLAACVEVRPGHLEVASPIDGAAGFARTAPVEDWIDPTTVGAIEGDLSGFLYAHHYAGDPAMTDPGAADLLVILGHRSSNPAFVDQLAAADPHTGYFREGWQVTAVRGAQLRVRRRGVELVVERGRHLRETSAELAVGDEVAVRFPPDSLQVSPGFYVTHADAGPAVGPLVRIYLTLTAAGAVAATGAALAALHACGLPYTYKILTDPERYRRRDTAVVYVHRDRVRSAVQAVLAARRTVVASFRDHSPAFTKPIVGGVALADEPTARRSVAPPSVQRERRSFGQQRCDVLARVLCALPGADQAHTAVTVGAALRAGVRGQGLDPDRLYLDDPAGGERHLTTLEMLR